MKLIILTQYFPPEIGAPQNRLYELALRLQKEGVEIEVLTAMPNYPQMVIHESYRGKKYVCEEMGPMKVHRSWIYVSQSRSIVPRLKNYFSFVWTSWRVGRKKLSNADFLLVESPPLFLGISAWLLARRTRAKLIFNVSDLWPESAEKLGLVTNRLLLWTTYRLEAFLYRKSALITGQTQGIVQSIRTRFPSKEVYWLPNGVDMRFYDAEKFDKSWRAEMGFAEADLLFLYAGIIGHAQGLEVILTAAESLKQRPEIKFILLGSGPVKQELMHQAKNAALDNVIFLDAVEKKKMPFVLAACDAAVIPLKRLDIFKGAIPSKIFESLSMRKPLVLGVEGEAKELFIDEGKAGLSFEPENAASLAQCVLQLADHPEMIPEFGANGNAYVRRKFDRDLIAADFLTMLTSHFTRHEN